MLEIEYEVDQRVGTLRFNAGKVNALGYDELRTFTSFLEEIPTDDELAVVLVSNNDDLFYAGHDITDVQEMDGEETDKIENRQTYVEFYRTIRELKVPVICAVDGPAIGAGAMVTALCDIRIASSDASFGIPEIDLGLVGGYALLHRHLPDGVLKYMIFTGEPIDASRAYNLGYVSQRAEDPERLAGSIATSIAAKSPETVRAWKRVMAMVRSDEELREFSHEQSLTNELMESKNTQEAIAAFLEEREPEFR